MYKDYEQENTSAENEVVNGENINPQTLDIKDRKEDENLTPKEDPTPSIKLFTNEDQGQTQDVSPENSYIGNTGESGTDSAYPARGTEETKPAGTVDTAEGNEFRWNYNEYVQNNQKKYQPSVQPYGPSYEGGKKKKAKSSLGLKIFAAAMSVFFLFTATSTVMLAIQSRNPDSLTRKNNDPIASNVNAVATNNSVDGIVETSQSENSGKELTTPEVIQKVKPSVVGIETTVTTTYFGRPYEQTGVGTGFILTSDGYIATNYHVIEGADQTKIKVTLNSGETYSATYIGGDEVSDLAVLKIDAKNLPAVELGDSDALLEGETVVAIGTPAGIEFAGSSTQGIISAINRNLEVSSGKGYTTKQMTVIQTDASINPGNSGGPLVNSKGQVIGINTMKISSSLYEGMGFAIPINGAIPIINELSVNGSVSSNNENSFVTVMSGTKIGIGGNDVTIEEAQQKGIPQGVKIASIEEGGPCDGVGIQLSDIIVAVNGKTITTVEELKAAKADNKAGDEITLTIYRNGDNYDFTITLAEAD